MKNVLIKLIGYSGTILHGDTAVFDRYKWLKKNLLPGPLSTLDAGCGSGAFAMYAAKIGNKAIGVSFNKRNNEVAEERANILKIKNIRFITGDLRKLDEMKKTLGFFDQIICFETIEHILNDEKLVRDFYSLLNPSGILLLTTPYKYYKSLYGDKEEFLNYEDGNHVRRGYTHEEMAGLLKKAGFKIKTEEYISGFFSQQLINLERRIAAVSPKLGWLVVLPFKLWLPMLDGFIYKITKYPYFCIGVVAIKN